MLLGVKKAPESNEAPVWPGLDESIPLSRIPYQARSLGYQSIGDTVGRQCGWMDGGERACRAWREVVCRRCDLAKSASCFFLRQTWVNNVHLCELSLPLVYASLSPWPPNAIITQSGLVIWNTYGQGKRTGQDITLLRTNHLDCLFSS